MAFRRTYSELEGTRFGFLTIIKILGNDSKGVRCCLAQCECGSIKQVRVSNLLSGNTTSCGCQHGVKLLNNLTGNRFGRWLVLSLVEDTTDRHTKWLCRCDCGTERAVYADNLVGNKTTSCGCYNAEKTSLINSYDLLGLRRGKLTVIKQMANKGRRKQWLIHCDCGNSFVTDTTGIITRKQEHCGCEATRRYKDKTGQRFGNLVAKYPKLDTNVITWVCQCDCGGEIVVRGSNLISGNTRSCGCLDDRVNTKPVSQQQRWLFEQLGGILNYKVGNFFIDLALLSDSCPIAIEYDSHYWHKRGRGIEERERRKTDLLLNKGWKLLRIKGVYKVPDLQAVYNVLTSFWSKERNYYEMFLDDWNEREQIYGGGY